MVGPRLDTPSGPKRNVHCLEILNLLVLNLSTQRIFELPPLEEGVSLCCCMCSGK